MTDNNIHKNSSYVQPHINYDESGEKDPRIEMKIETINALRSEGIAGVLANAATLLMNSGPAARAAGIVFSNLPGGIQLKIAADEGNPEAVKVQLAKMGSGALVGVGLALTFKLLSGVKVLTAVSKSSLYGWVASTLLTYVIGDAIEYDIVSSYYKHIYKIEYNAAKETGDIIVKAGTAGLEDIKSFLYYSNVLKEADDVYIEQGDVVYKVVRSEEYEDLITELVRRGYYSGNKATDIYNDIASLNGFIDFRYSEKLNRDFDLLINDDIQALHPLHSEKFILVRKDSLLFPLQGNRYDNIIFADDKGRNIYGGQGSDKITGGTADDTIYGDTSFYLNHRGQGNDTLLGGDGNDSILGEDGNDKIYGDRDNVATLTSYKGIDTLYGGNGNDTIYGGGNDDKIYGESGDDSIEGGSGIDVLLGGTGSDKVFGGTGNDYIDGGSGNDELIGEADDDFIWGDSGNDIIYGGTGNDTIYGSEGKDKIYGEDNNDSIYGGVDNDNIKGGSGMDTIYGGDGNDYIEGNSYSDLIYGNSGKDIINGGTSNDTIYGGDGSDKIVGYYGDDTIYGGRHNDQIYGSYDNDLIYGNAGNDKLFGDENNDIIVGGKGRDLLDAGTGYDQLYDESGYDTYIVRRNQSASITDIDGKGIIFYAGLELNGGKYHKFNKYNDSNGFWYTYNQNSGALTIKKEGTDGQITIESFSNGELGIHLRPDDNDNDNNNDEGQNPFKDDSNGDDTDPLRNDPPDGEGDDEDNWDGQLPPDGDPPGGDDGNDRDGEGDDEDNWEGSKPPEGQGEDEKGIKWPPASWLRALAVQLGLVIDPLIIDLDNDGLETIGLDRNIYFDMNNDGLAERTGWAGDDDGILVLDRNNDGYITSGAELFSEQTILSDGSNAENGFDALLDLDSNFDNKIDQNDEQYTKIKVWKSDGQLYQLDELRIKSIDLAYTAANYTDENENVLDFISKAEMIDGTSVLAGSYSFVSDPVYSVAVEEIDIPDDIASLPEAKGFGKVYSLRETMAKDTGGELKTLVEQFIAEENVAQRSNILDEILISWAGSENIDPNSNEFIDGKKMDVMEKFFAQKFESTVDLDNIDIVADRNELISEVSNHLNQAYHQLKEYVYAQLMLQTHLNDLASEVFMIWDYDTSQAKYDLSDAVNKIKEEINIDQEKGKELLSEFTRALKGWDLTGQSTYDEYYQSFKELGEEYEWIVNSIDKKLTEGTAGNDELLGSARFEAYLGHDGDDYIHSRQGDDIIYGGNGNDTLNSCEDNDLVLGQEGDDSILGGIGNDELNGGKGNDIINADAGTNTMIGGEGDDTINGGTDTDYIYGNTGIDHAKGNQGDDVYIFNLGDGELIIADQYYDNYKYHDAGNDTLKFGEGISIDDLTFSPESRDLIITINNTDDKITIKDYLEVYSYSGENRFSAIEKFEFADGTSVSYLEVDSLTKIFGTELNDIISGSDIGDNIESGSGNDNINGNEGNDLINAGAGNDTIYGGIDNDTINGGFGDDSIRATSYSTSHYNPDIDNDDYEANVLNGDAGNDTLLGYHGSDTLSGGTGNDFANGGCGNDTYIFNRGDGTLTINDYFKNNSYSSSLEPGGVDTLKFGENIVFDDLKFIVNNNDLIIEIKDTEDKIIIENHFEKSYNDDLGYGRYEQIEYLELNDGTKLSFENLEKTWVLTGTDLADAIYGSEMADIINSNSGNDTIYGNEGDDNIKGDIGDDLIYGGADSNTIDGGAGDDSIYGDYHSVSRPGLPSEEYGKNYLTGGIGNDIIHGNHGNDTLIGGTGNDFVNGRSGDDTYIFNKGDGTLTINDRTKIEIYPYDMVPGGNDTLKFGENIIFDDLKFMVNNNDLIIKIKDTEDKIIIENHFEKSYSRDYPDGRHEQLEYLEFNDGTQLSFEYLEKTWTLTGTELADNIQGSEMSDNIDSNNGNDTIYGNEGDDNINGAANSDIIYGGADNDTINGGAGDDSIYGYADAVSSPSSYVEEYEANYLNGGTGNDIIKGYHGNDTLIAGTGNDFANGRCGDDLYIFNKGDGNLTINDSFINTNYPYDMIPGGNDTLKFGENIVFDDLEFMVNNNDLIIKIKNTEDKIIIENHFEKSYSRDYPDGRHEQMEYLEFNDGTKLSFENLEKTWVLIGSELADTIQGSEIGDIINSDSGNDTVYGNEGADNLDGAAGNDIIYGGSDNDTINGSAGDDSIYGYAAAISNPSSYVKEYESNYLNGGAGNDFIMGYHGSDTLTGGTGNDFANGRCGDDTYVFNKGNGTLTISDSFIKTSYPYDMQPGGIDTLKFGENITVDDLKLSVDGYDLIIDIKDTNDKIIIESHYNESYNREFGVGRHERIEYFEFNDGTKLSSDEFEDLVFINGTISDDLLRGYNVKEKIYALDGNDTIYAQNGDDLLDGGVGADSMFGQQGNDIYIVDNINDVVQENAGEGIDEVQSSISWTIGENIENLTLTGLNQINGYGNSLDNILSGNSAANTLVGYQGNDIYVVDHINDIVQENSNEGIDEVQSSISWTIGENIENLTLTGLSPINGYGNNLDNILSGNSAANTLVGYQGNDIYVVDHINDTVQENADEGIDEIQSSITWTLGENIENLTLTGLNSINGYGNDLDNTLSGNSANNILDGKSGTDVLVGGQGDDIYVVDNLNDMAQENAAEGIDEIQSSITWTLGENIENLTLTGLNQINGYGNSLDNTLSGNNSANTLAGYQGDDIYLVDHINDNVQESAGEGIDEIQSSITWTLGENIENLTLTGLNQINGYGNSLDNILSGNNSANTLAGYQGDDIYLVDHINDNVQESAGEGIDEIQSSITWTLGENIENLTLTGLNLINGYGNNLNNTLLGNNTNNILDGKAGIDVLAGGQGDDLYVVDNAGDLIQENENEGIDKVNSSVSYTLTSNLENLTLTGSEMINGYGNNLNNIIDGNNLDNVIYGYDGNDTLYGNSGDDSLNGYDHDDLLIGGDGNDTLNGNRGNDNIQGGKDNDILYGELGDDILIGGLGNDTLNDSMGNDIYIFNSGDGQDTITDEKGNDVIKLGEGISLEDITFSGSGEDLAISFTNNNDKITIKNQLSSNDYKKIEVIEFADGSSITSSEILNKLELYGTELNDYIYSSVANDKIFGLDGDDTIYGGTGNDTIYGNEGNDIVGQKTLNFSGRGNNYLSGGQGNDTITGGIGNNTLIGGQDNDILEDQDGNDIYIFNSGDGQDTITDENGYDIIKFGDGISLEDIKFSGSGEDLVISFTNNNDKITIKSQLSNIYNAIELIEFTDGSSITSNEILNKLELYGTELNDYIYGSVAGDKIFGLDGNDTIYGGTGDDTIYGNEGNDVVGQKTLNFSGRGDDYLSGGQGNDTITGGIGNNILIGGQDNDILEDQDGNDIYEFSIGDGQDTITDENGYDIIKFGDGISLENIEFNGSNEDLVISFINNNDKIIIKSQLSNSYNAIEFIEFADGSSITSSEILNKLEIYGTELNDSLYGSVTTDKIYGLSGNDYINGASGNDTLYGHSGDDRLYGAADDDLLMGGEGKDTLNGDIGNDNIQGNEGNDILYGEFGDDTFTGGLGDDTLEGGRGNDTYMFNLGDNHDIITDKYIEPRTIFNIFFANNFAGEDTLKFGEGISLEDLIIYGIDKDLIIKNKNTDDQILIKDQFHVDTRIENFEFENGPSLKYHEILALMAYNGTDESESITGSIADDTIYGNKGDDTIYTSYGNDYIEAGDGNDEINGYYDNDIIYGNLGDDSITGGGGKDRLFGGQGDDLIEGDLQNDVLAGNKGNDTLIGGLSNDTYLFDIGDGEDLIIEEYNNYYNYNYGSTDRIIFGEGITPDNLIVSQLDNNLVIQFTNEQFELTNDKLTIQYQADNNRKIETFEFADNTTLSHTEILELGPYVGSNENDELILDETKKAAYGYAGNDSIVGNALNNLLVGGDGDDTLVGNGGDDTLNGDTGNDILYSGSGNNILSGGQDNDTYYITNPDTQVIENANEGIDKVYSAVDYTLTNNVENFELTDAAMIGFGNNLDNTIIGNANNNELSGSTGNDTLIGHAGDDTYLFNLDDGQDIIIDNSGFDSIKFGDNIGLNNLKATVEGSDLVVSIKDTTDQITLQGWFDNSENKLEQIELADGTILNQAQIEGLGIILGTSGDDTLEGTEFDNKFNALQGNDTITDQAGNDTYIYNLGDGKDVIIDLAGNDSITLGQGIVKDDLTIIKEANDLIISFNADDQITVKDWFVNDSNKIENLVFADESSLSAQELEDKITIIKGTDADDSISGNANDNKIYGLAGNDTLYGGATQDTLIGGIDNDTYIISDYDDVILEDLNAGIDTVQSNISYTLGNNVENLTLTGTDNINGYGNELDNNIIGNAGNNILQGGAGNDNYTYTSGQDTISGSSGSDSLIFESINSNDTVFLKSDNDLVVKLLNSDTNELTLQNWYSGNKIETFEFANETLSLDQIESNIKELYSGTDKKDCIFEYRKNSYIDAGAGDDRIYEFRGDDIIYAGEGRDRITDFRGDDIIYAGEGSDRVTDFRGDDIIYAGEGNDRITDFRGDDVINAGAGNDNIADFKGNDTYIFNQGDGKDYLLDMGSCRGTDDDKIQFSAGIEKDDIVFMKKCSSLVISYGEEDQVTVKNGLKKYSSIETIELSDGSTLSNQQVNQIVNDLISYAKDNHLSISTPNDIKENQELMNIITTAWS